MVVSWPNGWKLHVANTGPAYPLRAEFKGGYPVRMVFSEYNVQRPAPYLSRHC